MREAKDCLPRLPAPRVLPLTDAAIYGHLAGEHTIGIQLLPGLRPQHGTRRCHPILSGHDLLTASTGEWDHDGCRHSAVAPP